MVHGQPISPAGDLHQITLSPTTPARSGFKYDGSPISIKVPDDSASRSNWRSAVVVVIGVLLCTTSIAQVVLASGIRQKGIHVGILFEGEGYSTTAGNPAIGSLALGVAACFIAHSVMDKNKSRGKCVKGVKLTATIYSSTTLVVMAVWSCVELAVYLELASYEGCTVDLVGIDNGERDGCICSSDQSDNNTKVYIASDADISCDRVPDHAEDVCASYALMVSILVLTVAGIWWTPYTREPKTTSIVLEANPTPYVVTHTSPSREWGREYS